jgi:hypothetical protein
MTSSLILEYFLLTETLNKNIEGRIDVGNDSRGVKCLQKKHLAKQRPQPGRTLKEIYIRFKKLRLTEAQSG